jgi:hypothetical protein
MSNCFFLWKCHKIAETANPKRAGLIQNLK